MFNHLVKIGFSCGFAFLAAAEALAQVNPIPPRDYGRGPDLNVLTSPSLNGSTYSFSPGNGVGCPHTEFVVGGFGAAGNDWANDYSSYYSSGSGINNYGIAAGVRIPMAGEYAKYCRDYAKSLADKLRSDSEQARRSDQISLLQACYWLLANRINYTQAAFLKGQFSSLAACNELDFTPLASDRPLSEAPKSSGMMLSPAPALPPQQPAPTFQYLVPAR